VLVLPFRQNDTKLIAGYRQLVEGSGAFELLPTSRETYVRASLYRAQLRMKTPDAVHMATAVEAGCAVFLTVDQGVKGPKGVEVVRLGED
jgi:predicted nucleic acid-binding protein